MPKPVALTLTHRRRDRKVQSPYTQQEKQGREIVVVVSPDPKHVPVCPMDPVRYERLYAFNQNLDDQLPENPDWQEIRIKPGLNEEDVYRLLPSASDFEFSGYLTKSRIRYFKGDDHSTGMLMAKPCTFHSHPTKNPYLADIPSLPDIHSFLFYRHIRSITVGATKLWVWDKTRATMGTVRKLAAWMEANHFRVVAHFMETDFDTWQARYVHQVMHDLGWAWPETMDDMDAHWPRILREVFKIKVRVFSRGPGVNPS